MASCTWDEAGKAASDGRTMSKIVLDTNIVLDLFVFKDPACAPLSRALETGEIRWIATSAMRDELERVLAYAHILPRLTLHQLTPSYVLAQFDRLAHIEPVAPRATAICKDRDDQRFVDLAVAHRATLLSKDKAVLCMSKKLFPHGVYTKSAI